MQLAQSFKASQFMKTIAQIVQYIHSLQDIGKKIPSLDDLIFSGANSSVR